jgi:Mor family transcriptional regulator
MTRKQLKRNKRDKEILSFYHRLPIEDIAEKFNISTATIYRIINNYEKLR